MATDQLGEARARFLADLAEAGGSPGRVEQVRVRYAGRRSGMLRDLEDALKALPKEEEPAYGKALNELKALNEERLADAQRAAQDYLKKVGHEARFLYETTYRGNNGNDFPVEANITLLMYGKRPYLLAVCRNIAEEPVRNSVESLRMAVKG